MKKNLVFTTALYLLSVFSVSTLNAEALDGEQALVTVRKMVSLVRFSQTKPEFADKALESVGVKEISEYLLDKHYAKITPEQDARFQKLILEYIKYRAFPTALNYIKDIDLSYDTPQTEGEFVKIRSSIVYAGSERIVFTWVVKKRPDGYFLTDFLDEKGVSAMEANRDKQIQPLIRKEGIEGMIRRMERVVATYRKQK